MNPSRRPIRLFIDPIVTLCRPHIYVGLRPSQPAKQAGFLSLLLWAVFIICFLFYLAVLVTVDFIRKFFYPECVGVFRFLQREGRKRNPSLAQWRNAKSRESQDKRPHHRLAGMPPVPGTVRQQLHRMAGSFGIKNRMQWSPVSTIGVLWSWPGTVLPVSRRSRKRKDSQATLGGHK